MNDRKFALCQVMKNPVFMAVAAALERAKFLLSQMLPHRIPNVLPDEQASPEQIAIFRLMTPAQRWRAAHRLYWTMRRHKTAFLRSQYPDWSEKQVEGTVRGIFLHART